MQMSRITSWLAIGTLAISLALFSCNSGDDAATTAEHPAPQSINATIDSLFEYVANHPGNPAGYVRLASLLSTLQRYADCDRILRRADSCGVIDRRLYDLRDVNLADWAHRAFAERDSQTGFDCVKDLIERPLADSVLQAVAVLVGSRYQLRRLTENVTADYAPRFSGDGKAIVYFSRLEREQLEYPGLFDLRYQTQICLQGLDDDQPRVISDGKASDFFPDISPDGRYVVCQRSDGDTLKDQWMAAENSYLYLYDLENGSGRRLGGPAMFGRCPRFTPSGKEIIFITGCSGPEGYISTINPATGDLTARYRRDNIIRNNKPGAVFSVSLFADEKRMVFQAGFLHDKGVYVGDQFGRNLVRLTSQLRTWNDDPSEWHPTVSLQNNKIVFLAHGRDGDELFRCNPDGSDRIQITFDGRDKSFPAYSPDGRYIAYGAKERGSQDAEYEIYILDLETPVRQEQIAARIRQLTAPRDH